MGRVSRILSGDDYLTARSRLAYAVLTPNCALPGLNLASRRKFCAVAARRNSSLAPHEPRTKRPSRRMRLRWANSISTFFRRRQAASCSGVEARARATSRASSCRLRGILRTTAFGQQRALSVQTPDGEARLLAAGCPLDQAEYGDCLTYGSGHYATWAHGRRDRTVDPALRALVRSYEYEDWPRGRIVFDQSRDVFVLYADRNAPKLPPSLQSENPRIGRRASSTASPRMSGPASISRQFQSQDTVQGTQKHAAKPNGSELAVGEAGDARLS
jgi:hypothetical protein